MSFNETEFVTMHNVHFPPNPDLDPLKEAQNIARLLRLPLNLPRHVYNNLARGEAEWRTLARAQVAAQETQAAPVQVTAQAAPVTSKYTSEEVEAKAARALALLSGKVEVKLSKEELEAKAAKALAVLSADLPVKKPARGPRPPSKREEMSFGTADTRKGRPASYLQKKSKKSAESVKVRNAMKSSKGSKS